VVKVLDFGLAKLMSSRDPENTGNADNSPTLTFAATEAGMILGTAAYMAPEQARGKAEDQRADIWAFGVILFELLTGNRLFKGDDLTEILASVVKDTPDMTQVPRAVRGLLRACHLQRCGPRSPLHS
jgi:serine/threonine-protein kinase